jgi:small-conductance mechanosensitive channel
VDIIKQLLDFSFFTLGGYSLKVYNVAGVMLLFVLAFIVRKIIYQSLRRSKKLEESKKFTIYQLFRYLLFVIISISSLQILGVNISVLVAGSAALLVGIGLGLQTLFSDFVSGIILLLDGTIKVGDIIEVNGKIFKVEEIKLRCTTVKGRDENFVILPNTDLTRQPLINWTHHKSIESRFSVEVGVAHNSDTYKVHKLLKTIALESDKVLKSPEPIAMMEELGDFKWRFVLYFWTDDVFGVELLKSELRMAIASRFKQEGIEIPKPHQVIQLAHESNQKSTQNDFKGIQN